MKKELTLSDQEWELVLELLRRERGEIPAEIRHTDSREYRHALQAREAMMDNLIARIKDAL